MTADFQTSRFISLIMGVMIPMGVMCGDGNDPHINFAVDAMLDEIPMVEQLEWQLCIL